MTKKKNISAEVSFEELAAQAKSAGKSVGEFLMDNKLTFADSMGGYTIGTVGEIQKLAQSAGKTVEEFLQSSGLRLPTASELTEAFKSRAQQSKPGPVPYWAPSSQDWSLPRDHLANSLASVRVVRQSPTPTKA